MTTYDHQNGMHASSVQPNHGHLFPKIVAAFLVCILAFIVAVFLRDKRNSAYQALLHKEETIALVRHAVPAPVANWHDPTGGVQPRLSNYTNLALFVNLQTNIVAVESNGTIIYRMLTSPGVNNETPTGYWRTGVKGLHFYSASEGEGADYYTVIHGNYLFHTVPTKQAFGSYIPSQGDILGQPGSHGCCRLSIADAYWLWTECPSGTPVYIYNSKSDLQSLLAAHPYADGNVNMTGLFEA